VGQPCSRRLHPRPVFQKDVPGCFNQEKQEGERADFRAANRNPRVLGISTGEGGLKKKPITPKVIPGKKPSGPLRDKADALFSLFIRARGVCEAKGWIGKKCFGPLTCSHRIGRDCKVLRWDERNADCLCLGCHQYFESHKDEYWKFIEHHSGLTREAMTYISHNEPPADPSDAIKKYRGAA